MSLDSPLEVCQIFTEQCVPSEKVALSLIIRRSVLLFLLFSKCMCLHVSPSDFRIINTVFLLSRRKQSTVSMCGSKVVKGSLTKE